MCTQQGVKGLNSGCAPLCCTQLTCQANCPHAHHTERCDASTDYTCAPCSLSVSPQVRHVAELPRRINEAFAVATSGRPGPVLVDLPKDIMAAVCTESLCGEVCHTHPVKHRVLRMCTVSGRALCLAATPAFLDSPQAPSMNPVSSVCSTTFNNVTLSLFFRLHTAFFGSRF